jgi:lysophospholipase L1-like esterase
MMTAVLRMGTRTEEHAMPRPRLVATIAATTTALALAAAPAALAAPAAPAAAAARAAWVGSWATSATIPGPTGPSAAGLTDTTLRQKVHLSVGGDQVRVRLTNVFGTTPLVVDAATVAPSGAGPAVDPATVRPLTWGGLAAATIPVGAEWLSDPVRLGVGDDSDLTISVHFPGPTGPLTQHPASFATNWTAPGNATTAAGGYTVLGTSWLALDSVEVRAVSAGSVVFFGDSITDGVRTLVDANHRYPDYVADRSVARPQRQEFGVLNAGISGNRLLADAGTAGQSALARFDRDVAGQVGVRTVVLLLGINDIGVSRGAVTAEELIAVHRQFVARAHALGIRVFGGTLTPYEGAGYATPEGEADRQALNAFIRTSPIYDGVVDFDRATRDPAHPTRFLPAYDAGDHLHPNDAGMAAMAAAVPVGRLVG